MDDLTPQLLSPGSRLGGYEVIRPLGAGGMGEVYRARDARLERDVAIKVLAPRLAHDKDALARFEREARTVSALNHPHIVHIYEIGEAAISAGPTRYIAMELVEGETLRARLQGGATLESLLEPMAQVADALAKAHKAGIVHRDLKPENVMITPDGYPKVLDFGLAKLVEAKATTTNAETESVDGRTKSGMLVGTPSYMSPEQVQGKPLDHRSDIFSLGCILYEIATGRRPFKGDSSVATLHAIVYEEPPSIRSLKPTVPPSLAAIVERCLAKDPERRYAAIQDIASELRALARSGATPSPESLPTTGLTTQAAGISGRLPTWPAAMVVAAALLLGALWWARRPGASMSQPVAPQVQAQLGIEKLTNRGNAGSPAVSPDGRYVAYAAGGGIWLRDVVEKSESRLMDVPLENWISRIAFSKDGRLVYVSQGRGLDGKRESTLYKVPLIGGTPQVVRSGDWGTPSPDWKHTAMWSSEKEGGRLKVADIDGSHEIDLGAAEDYLWAPDSNRLLVDRVGAGIHRLYWIGLDGSTEHQLADLPKGYATELQALRPDQRIVACWFSKKGDRWARRRLYAIDLTDGSNRPIGDISWNTNLDDFLWLPDGSGLVATEWDDRIQQNQMWFASYPEGKVRRIPADATGYSSAGLTADGTRLVAAQSIRRSEVMVSSNGDKGPFSKVATVIDVNPGLCWTQDNKLILSLNEAGSFDLFAMDADGSNRRPLTFDKTGNEFDPAASPDGRYIVYVLDREGEGGLQRINRDGTGLMRLTQARVSERRDRAPRFTSDGRYILYSRWLNGPALWKVSVNGGAPVLVKGPQSQTEPAPGDRAYGASASPDGKSLAFFYATLSQERFSALEVAISTIDGQILKRFPHYPSMQIGDNQRVRWNADGTAVYYQTIDYPRQLWRQPVAGGPPVQITNFEDDGVGAFDLSFDGKRLACTRNSGLDDIVMITNFH